MPRDIQTASGIVLRNIPDRFTDGGALDLAVQRGIITAEVAAATVGDRQQVETGGILDELAIGAGHAVASRSLGLLDADVAPPDTLAASIGGALPLIAGSLLAPGTIAAQAAFAGGAELLRDPTNLKGAAGQAVLAGGGAGLGNLASRVLTGIRGTAGEIGQTLGQRTGSNLLQRLEAGLSSGGGFDALKKATTLKLNQTAAKSIGQNADNLSPDVLQRAAVGIGSIFKNLLPTTSRANIAGLRASIDDLSSGVAGTRLGRAMPDADDISGDQLVALRAALVDRSRTLKGSAPGAADDLDVIIDDLDEIVAGIIGPDALPLLRVAREGWKNLKILESLPTVRATGNVGARQLAGRLAAPRGYGSTFIRDRGGVLKETQDLFNATRQAGRLSEIVGDSGTATRLAALGTVGFVAGAALEGDIEGALTGAAIGLTPALLGRLSTAAGRVATGTPSALATRIGGAAGANLNPDE